MRNRQPSEVLSPLPVVNYCSGILAVFYVDHEEGEGQEEHAHAKAHPVHRLVAHKDLTVHAALDSWDVRARTPFTEARYL